MGKRGYLNRATASRHWENRKDQIEPYFILLENIIGNLTGKRLLDVGCAAGVDVSAFAKKGLIAEGIDVKKEFIDEARQKFPNLKFEIGNAENLPYNDDSFDIVFSINTLFYTNIEESLKEFIRILKKGGSAIFNFDTEIVDLDKNKIFHSESLERLKQIVTKNQANIIQLGKEVNRTDLEPFKHRHVFRVVVIEKR